MTLTTRLSTFFLAMLAVVLIGFSVGVYALADRYLTRQTQDRLETAANTLLAAADVGAQTVEWDPKERQVNFDASPFGSQVVWLVTDERGNILERSKWIQTTELMNAVAEQTHLADRPSPPMAPSASITIEARDWRTGDWRIRQQWVRPTSRGRESADESKKPAKEHNAQHSAILITVGSTFGPVYAALRELATALAGLSLGVWVTALLLGRVVCRRALAPVNQMAFAASRINADDFSKRLPSVATRDELDQLNRSFNGLLDRLQESFERQKRFTGDASHQLRTPLAIILGQVDVALRRERPADDYRQTLETVRNQTHHLHRIVESLLFLARANSEAALPDCDLIDLKAWLPAYLESLPETPRTADLSFEDETTGPSHVKAQSALLSELLNILVDNACKYSPPGTPITICLRNKAETVLIAVEDRGSGIAASDLPRLFTPFFRAEQSRRQGISGTGLGLSIAARLAKIFGGTLTAESEPNAGSRFSLQLPKQNSRAPQPAPTTVSAPA